ncbi:ABC transporter substrate-binding protein [Pseudonocardia sp. NPDC049635]|uniref:ABC transporter substrate-binding protein n=1 Tax=Pseudonocardia sp. NPDC049635 TaxID=3155506 RepID=UPI00340D4A9D
MARIGSTVVLLVTALAAVSCGTAGDATTAQECRTVAHELGSACVPQDPQRIVTLDSVTVLPTLLELEVPVAGALRVYPSGDPFPDYLDESDTAGIELVGTMQEIDLEQVAALQPDLIIGTAPMLEPVLAQLEQIAPTVGVGFSFYHSGWADDIRLIGATVGRESEVEEQLAGLAAEADKTRTQVMAGGAERTLSRVDVYQGAPLYYSYGCTWIGEVLASAGVRQPDGQRSECTDGDIQSALNSISLEEVSVLEADAIVAYQQQDSDSALGASPLAELERSPLWQDLDAVRGERVFVFGDAWGLGASVPAAEQVLADLRTEIFTG